MNKYRIKTEIEFLLEYGINWRTIMPIMFPREMDFLLGKNLSYNDIEKLINKKTNKLYKCSMDLNKMYKVIIGENGEELRLRGTWRYRSPQSPFNCYKYWYVSSFMIKELIPHYTSKSLIYD